MSDKTIRNKRIAYELIEQSHNQLKKTQEKNNETILQVSENKRVEIIEPSPRFYMVFGRIIGKEAEENGKKDNDSNQQRKEEDHTNNPSEDIVHKDKENIEDFKSNVSVFEKLSNNRYKLENNSSRKISKCVEKNLKLETQNCTEDKERDEVSVFKKLSHGSK